MKTVFVFIISILFIIFLSFLAKNQKQDISADLFKGKIEIKNNKK